VVSINDQQQSNYDLWTVDLAKALKTRFTFGKSEDRYPVWSPDGSRIAFASVRDGARNLYWKISNGATDEELLLKSNEEKVPTDWSRDSKYLLYTVTDPKTKADLWYLPLADGKSVAERKGVRFLGTEFTERQGRFSPDGRYGRVFVG
jgi:Tol biopolymer transport system component